MKHPGLSADAQLDEAKMLAETDPQESLAKSSDSLPEPPPTPPPPNYDETTELKTPPKKDDELSNKSN